MGLSTGKDQLYFCLFIGIHIALRIHITQLCTLYSYSYIRNEKQQESYHIRIHEGKMIVAHVRVRVAPPLLGILPHIWDDGGI